LSLDRVILESVAKIPIYIRLINTRDGAARFTLYCTPQACFAERHRERLRTSGIKFVYIPLVDQMKYRRQAQAQLLRVAADPLMSITLKSQLVYETSIEVMNEVLAEEAMDAKSAQVKNLARAVTTLVMKDRKSFSHLFAVSQHDFYTATHLVNVGTWMVSLASAMGVTDPETLEQVCQAGLLHDVGKLFVREEVLNKRGLLTEGDWAELRGHPQHGAEYLAKCSGIPEIVRQVALGHHERLDGSGYPGHLAGEQIDQWNRICAVVDSFDAMTAFRPFKKKAMSFGEALGILQKEAPAKYDAKAVEAWVGLMREADRSGVLAQPLEEKKACGQGRRANPRFTIECPVRIHRMTSCGETWREGEGIVATAHSICRSGMGFLSQHVVEPSHYARVYLLGVGTLANKVLDGQIVRCRAYRDGWHDVGMQFASLAKEREAALAAAPSPA
jgi:HD-GYP domain-containing protein (c-di-GMP phosphodiesterase class II)